MNTHNAELAVAATSLPANLALGAVRLRVRDVARATTFYTDVLGLRPVGSENGVVRLGAGDAILVELEESCDAPPRQRGTTGLFHLAILVPDRPSLAVVLQRLLANRVRLGASDHLVSEALYISDPDGNGIEIYRDRPQDEWEWQGRSIHMATMQLDLRALLADLPAGTPVEAPLPPGTRMGHVHLQVADLGEARRFYVDRLGFDITTERYPGALFVSAGGYHHHLGLNVWDSRNGGPAADGALGLVHYTILLPDAAAVAQVRRRLAAAGESLRDIPGGFAIADPWRTTAHIRVR